MLELLKKEEGFYVLTCHNYKISNTMISIEDIPNFENDFSIFLHSDYNRKKYGFLYDVNICFIRVTSDNTCDVDFLCRISGCTNKF